MFEMGFEPQVRSICDHVRPDRQVMLFSATFKKRIERLARDTLVDPVKIVQVRLKIIMADRGLYMKDILLFGYLTKHFT
jgi:superfamily II DNA/RNA helicase